MNSFKEVKEIRKKIFVENKYKEYESILNKLMIPEDFDPDNCIPKVFEDEKYKEINCYAFGEYKELYKMIKKEIVNLPINNNPIIVVHPFYPILRHANFLVKDREYLNKYLKYEEQMIKLLKYSKEDIILFESPDSLARYTYTFLKYKKIKKIVLTEHSYGKVLDKEDIKNMDYQKAKIVGCYEEHCIKDVENELRNIEIERIDELIMERFC